MTSGLESAERSTVRANAARPPAVGAATTAVLFATAAEDGERPAAALAWEATSILRRLLDQLADLGVGEAHVITRPGWDAALRRWLEGAPLDARMHVCASEAEDLTTLARVARESTGRLVVAHADIVTQREALAGLLADPRLGTSVLATGTGTGRPFTFRTRTNRGRVMSASSAYHSVWRPNAAFLGVLKVTPGDLDELARVADRLAELTRELPEHWRQQFTVRSGTWRSRLARRADDPADDVNGMSRDAVSLAEEDEAELRRRLAAAPHDVVSLVLVGLVRSGVHVGNSWLRRLFWARPLSPDAVERATVDITRYDEDRVLLDSAVKANDGFFTTFFVSPYSKYMARFAARRGWTPNQVTSVSMLIGVAAAAAFATGSRAGLIVGAILVQAAFTTDCVDGQLARYTRTFSKLGAWLDSVFDRSKEYVVFAGLAIGASRAGDDVWLLAAAALTLQTARHALEFSYGVSRQQVMRASRHPPLEQPSDALGGPPIRSAAVAEAEARAEVAPPAAPATVALPRRILAFSRRVLALPGVIWMRKMIGFPIGERFATISVTAALFTPRTTFTVLLVWGGLAAVYTTTGRILRSAAGG